MRTDWEHLRMVSASAISPVLAYYTPTKGFLLALVLAFAFNIYAGMKADGVSFTCCENFSFGKFKMKDEAACLRYAHKVANDPDGYDGMIFCRWTADAIGKAIKLDWEKFV